MKRRLGLVLILGLLTAGVIVAAPGPAQAHCVGPNGVLPDVFLRPSGHADADENGLSDGQGTYGDGDGRMQTWGDQLTLAGWCRIWHDEELFACANATCLTNYGSVDYWCCQEWTRSVTAINAGTRVTSQKVIWGGLNPFAGQCYFMWSYFGTTSNHRATPYAHRYGDEGARSPWNCRV